MAPRKHSDATLPTTSDAMSSQQIYRAADPGAQACAPSEGWPWRMRIAMLAAIAVACCANVVQAQEWEWAVSAGGIDTEYPRATAVDADGNTFVVGHFWDSMNIGTITLVSAGGFDAFVAKYSPTGEPLWARSVGNFGFDAANGVASDAAGNVYVAGKFVGSVQIGSFTLTSLGGDDIFLVKYAPDGQVLWARRAGGTSGDSPEAVAVDAAGDAYVTGSFEGTAAFGLLSLTSAGGADVFVAKYTSAGDGVWALRAGGAGALDFGDAVAVHSSGDVYVSGEFVGTADFGQETLTSAGSIDAFVAKVTPAGEIEWGRRAGGVGDDAGYGVAVNAAGESYLVGFFRASAVFGATTLTSAGNQDVFLAKYSPAGDLIWARRAGGQQSDLGEHVAVDSAGNAYVTGYFYGDALFDSHFVTSAGDSDVFVAGYRADGTATFAVRLGGSLADWLACLSLVGSDAIRVAGIFRGSMAVGATTLVSAGLYDVFLASLDVTGTVATEGSGHRASLALESPAPNPSSGNATIAFYLHIPASVRLALYDAIGREQRIVTEGVRQSGPHEVLIDLTGLSTGVYVLRLETATGVVSRRLTVAR